MLRYQHFLTVLDFPPVTCSVWIKTSPQTSPQTKNALHFSSVLALLGTLLFSQKMLLVLSVLHFSCSTRVRPGSVPPTAPCRVPALISWTGPCKGKQYCGSKEHDPLGEPGEGANGRVLIDLSVTEVVS